MRQGFLTPGGLSDLPKIFRIQKSLLPKIFRIQKSLHYPQVLGVNQFPVERAKVG
jgi:hypothetical protein